MENIRQCSWHGQEVESVGYLSVSYSPYNVNTDDYSNGELSGVPCYAWIDSMYKKNEDDILREIEAQCLAMLEDVKVTNEKARSLSAFMSIFAFIGTLAKLAFKKNPEYSFHDQHDLRMYLTLIDRFILGCEDTQVLSSVINRHGLAEALYRKVRCGLLHGDTLVNEKMPNDEKIVIHLSHKQKDKRSLMQINDAIINLQSGSGDDVDFVVGANVMCREIQKAIEVMFHGEEKHGIDSGVKESILGVYKEEPFVVDIKHLKIQAER